MRTYDCRGNMKSMKNIPHENQQSKYKLLTSILLDNEEWLMDRILNYALKRGYSLYTSTLKEAWRLSISGLTSSILQGFKTYTDVPELNPEEDINDDPVAMFGIVQAQKHRERGVSLNMFLGLMKYYRQSYIDLLYDKITDLISPMSAMDYELFLNRIFDRIEIGFCVEWSGSKGDSAILELQINNRMMTNEKNKYLTIFESIPNPVIILNRAKKIDNMNLLAAELFKKNILPGSQYYCLNRDRQLEIEQCLDEDKPIEPSCFGGTALSEILPWLEHEINNYVDNNLDSMVFEKQIDLNSTFFTYRIKISKSLDISGKFDGIIIILEDITSLKKALADVKTLSGLLPICSHCKKIRDDKGYWTQIEYYIHENSEATFSHGICQECAKKHYPDMNIYEE